MERKGEDLRDGVLELGGVDALGLLDLPPGGVHLRRRRRTGSGGAGGEEGEQAGKWRRQRLGFER